ncbi:MAG: hypothetical protein JWN04_5581, partial [Myxococcaceae bacterium]|nr:hypothetical protein [Myxococcaceae bacterium]
RDVSPVFARSCAFSSCHGTETSARPVFLGTRGSNVARGLVNKMATQLPTMPYVTPGEPRESYLMRKMDASHCALDAQCDGGSCQGSMPKDALLLEVSTRDIVRRWIAQGAKDD